MKSPYLWSILLWSGKSLSQRIHIFVHTLDHKVRLGIASADKLSPKHWKLNLLPQPSAQPCRQDENICDDNISQGRFHDIELWKCIHESFVMYWLGWSMINATDQWVVILVWC